MTDVKSLNEAQTAMLKEHLQLVFKKVTNPLSTSIPTILSLETGVYKPEKYYCSTAGFSNFGGPLISC